MCCSTVTKDQALEIIRRYEQVLAIILIITGITLLVFSKWSVEIVH